MTTAARSQLPVVRQQLQQVLVRKGLPLEQLQPEVPLLWQRVELTAWDCWALKRRPHHHSWESR